jgi:glucosamine--fructose-6-phosphate aminotransferase (isomerizing)
MCGIFGVICQSDKTINHSLSKDDFNFLLNHSERRGRDSSGYVIIKEGNLSVLKRDKQLSSVLKFNQAKHSSMCFGHSRLITNGLKDNQPVVIENNILVHNGIVVNVNDVFDAISRNRVLKIDSEAILAAFLDSRDNGFTVLESVDKVLKLCKGTISAVLFSRRDNSIVMFSNNGSLYKGNLNGSVVFSSEKYPLDKINCTEVTQVFKPFIIDLSSHLVNVNHTVRVDERNTRNLDLIPSLGILNGKEKILQFDQPNLRRCTKCILPETMPFITFDQEGVCNYCKNYKIRNNPKPLSNLERILSKYKKSSGNDCIVPFSGGRDSFFGLHLAVKELGMRPITYTYDWGMVTDLARRNISRMCSELGVENVIVADNIQWKRMNVRKNLVAWLNNPDLGMVNILTAGDKHFFRHVEDIKKQTGISLDLWSVNPLEVTHFKAGFLGVQPDFLEDKVYSNGWKKQLNYQKLRFNAMLKSPGYFNSSVFDTLLGEYYRSFHKKKDYYHIFDYYVWDENRINDIILNQYGFEMAPDTPTTWRIGDGTAAFYNYIYYTVAGFSEHDTFRSNQIREGQIDRETALKLVQEENKPRYQNIFWYLEAIGLDYETVIKRINAIPKLYNF